MGGACSTHWRDEKCFKILDGKPEGTIPVGRPKRRWKDIKFDLKQMGC
jgi:hypothetical protein